MLWLVVDNPAGYGGRSKRICLEDSPSPTIMAGGIYGDNLSHYWIEDDGIPFVSSVKVDKPEYRVPTMVELAQMPRNGYRFASSFSGTGGASLGAKFAGFEGVWASEFIPAAIECYALNFPEVPIDGRDIREVEAKDIVEATGVPIGELDYFEGSPPCASFSTAGKREAGWGQSKSYSDSFQRTDDLFHEFARVLKDLQPRAFSAENVSGLVKGVAKGYFKEIHKALVDAGYVVQAKLVDSQYAGVPQARQRVFFMGIRKDLGVAPRWVKPLPYRYSVRDAIPWIVRHGTAANYDVFAANHRDIESTMVDSEAYPSPTILQSGTNIGAGLVDAEVREPNDITGTAIGGEYDSIPEGQSSEKYFQLVKAHQDRPSPTVTASGGGRGVAGVVHPTERRKFTIEELRRICSFPDDFQLTGTYAQQWERLGRAVPPMMGAAVSLSVYDALAEADGHERPGGLKDGSWHRRMIERATAPV